MSSEDVRVRRAGRWAAAGVLAVGLAVLVGGCQSAQPTDRGAEFRASLTEATAALNDADLRAARAHVDAARGAAVTSYQREKVRSLERFIEGTEALMEGRSADAAAAWSRIEDPHLYAEVRQRARAIGVEVPGASGRDWRGSLEASRR